MDAVAAIVMIYESAKTTFAFSMSHSTVMALPAMSANSRPLSLERIRVAVEVDQSDADTAGLERLTAKYDAQVTG